VIPESGFKTLKPFMNETINVESGLPGISGRQSVTTDLKGFRTTKNIQYDKGDTFRVFAVGGSTTEQIYLDDKKTWTHLLQQDLSDSLSSNVEVINTGVSGLRAEHHLATLKYISQYHPDLVIFLVGINDWNKHIKSNFHNPLSINLKTLDKTWLGQLLMASKSYFVAVNDDKYERKVNGDSYKDKRNSLSKEIVKSFRPGSISNFYKKSLLEIKNVCRKSSFKCMLVTQPSGYKKEAADDFKKGFWMTPPNQTYTLLFDDMVYLADLYNNYLISFSYENDIAMCDAANKLDASYENFYDDTHFNTNGANNMKSVLADCIKDIYK
jgi:lysophospholipase L1-like esterase